MNYAALRERPGGQPFNYKIQLFSNTFPETQRHRTDTHMQTRYQAKLSGKNLIEEYSVYSEINEAS